MYQQYCLLSFKTNYWFYFIFNQVDGETRSLPILLDSGRVSVYSSAQYIFVSTDFGLSVGYSGSWAVNIIVPADYSGVTCGICGNFNGQNNDDFMTPSGALAPSADQFGQVGRWRTSCHAMMGVETIALCARIRQPPVPCVTSSGPVRAPLVSVMFMSILKPTLMTVCSMCAFLETVMMSCVARSKPMRVPVNLTMLLSTPGEKAHPVVSEIFFFFR